MSEVKHISEFRMLFLRRELFKFERQAVFNRTHYSEAEAACWDALAADCRAAITKAAGSAAADASAALYPSDVAAGDAR